MKHVRTQPLNAGSTPNVPQWIQDLLVALEALPAKLQNTFVVAEDARSLICTMDPPCLFDQDSGQYRTSMASVLGRMVDRERCTCSCYGCEAFKGSSFAARQLGFLNELSFGSKPSGLEQAAEWYGLAAINSYEPAWVDLARVFRFMINSRRRYEDFLQKLEPVFRKSASLADIEDQINFARFLISTGIDEKIAEGRCLLHTLGENGHPQALFLLGLQESDPTKSIDLITRAAQENYAPAMLHVAKMFDNGVWVGRDVKMAIYWYERASEERHPMAMFRLAQLIQDTDSQRALALFETILNTASDRSLRSQAQFFLGLAAIETDEEFAVNMLTQAANAGLGSAQAKLGLHLLRKKTSSDELEQGLQYLKAAVTHSDCDPEAALALGCYYLDTDHDSHQGLSLVTLASNSGYPPALVLGYRLLKSSDPAKALSWLQQAASMGFAEAQTELGQAYEEGFVNGAPDLSQALICYKKASAQSDVRAQFQLYTLLGHNQDVTTTEYANAIRWLQLSADHGYMPAQARLGKLLLELTDEQKDALNLCKLDYMHYLDLAAEQGDTISACEASKLRLENDTYVEKAICDLDNAAKAGCVTSQMLLAGIYLSPLFPMKAKAMFYLSLAAEKFHYARFLKCALMCNVKEFAKMTLDRDQHFDQAEVNRGFFETKLAAIQGNVHCQFLLAQCYQRGIIVDADFPEARRWLKHSASAGNPDAAQLLAFLSSGSEANHWTRAAIDSCSKDVLFPEKLETIEPNELSELLRKAADSGNQFAMVLYALRCENYSEKLQWMEKAANLGVPRAQRWLAISLQDRNHAAAWAEWLERAAEGGDLDAQREMAAWTMHPRHGIFQKRIARRLSGAPFCIGDYVLESSHSIDELKSLAESGNHRAQYCLALQLFDNFGQGPISKVAYKKARRWMRRSARFGNPCAHVALALLYMNDIGDSKPCLPRAFSLLLEASECGYNEAFYILALRFSPDLEKSLQFLERAAILGHHMALNQYVSQMFGLGKTISNEIMQRLQQAADVNIESAYWLCRIAPDIRSCVKTLKKLASQNHIRAQVLLGDLLFSGAEGLPCNHQVAQLCYHRAALANNEAAQIRLGNILFAKGDYDQSLDYFEQACAQGNVAALEWLSLRPARSVSSQIRSAVQILITSDGPAFAFFLASLFETDLDMQKKYLEIAAGKGHVLAQYHLGRMLLKIGEIQLAIVWLKNAADQGNVHSCLDLSLCLLTGYDSVSDWLTARQYLIRAVHLGSSKAAGLLSTLHTMISFKYPAVSNRSISHALFWSATAKRFDQNFDHDVLAFSINACVREHVNRFLNESDMRNRLTALEVIHSNLPLPVEERQNLGKLILEMCGTFQNPCDLCSDVFIEMQKSSMIRRDSIAFPDVRRLVSAGVQFLFGDCIVPDVCLASRFLLDAAGRGSASAQTLVGFLYELGGLGVCALPWEAWAAFWYCKSAMSGNVVGCLSYAELFERKGCWTTAALFYHRAAELGSSSAHARLQNLFCINSELQDAVINVIRAARNERSLALLSGCYSESSPLFLLQELPVNRPQECGLSKANILRTIFEFAGQSQLVWYPEPEVNFAEFIRSQAADPNYDHVHEGDRILSEEPSDVLTAIKQYKSAARKGNTECMVLLGNAIDCGWVSSAESACSWYQNASLVGSSLATQWIASSLLTGSSQNAITAFATLNRAQQQHTGPTSSSILSHLYLSALSAGLTDAFPPIMQTAGFDTGKRGRRFSLLLSLARDSGKKSPLYLACESMNILPDEYSRRDLTSGLISGLTEIRRRISLSYAKNPRSESDHIDGPDRENITKEPSGRFDPVIHQIFSKIFEMSGDNSNKT